MAGHKARLAERIDAELQRRGEDHTDLAHALRVNPRTAERWVSGETEPQRRLRKPVADYLGLSIEELWPDLEAAEKALRDQLDRIEAKLDEILSAQRGLLGDHDLIEQINVGVEEIRRAPAVDARRAS